MSVPVSFRAQVKSLALKGQTPRDISKALSRSAAAVQRMLYKLRLAGELPPPEAIDPASLPGRVLALIESAGEAGRSAAALQAELVCAPPDLRRALRRLCELEAAREDADQRFRSIQVAPAPVTTVARPSAELEDIVGHALLLAMSGQRPRAIAFLRRACDRLPPGKFQAYVENWLAIADMLAAPETHGDGGRLRGYGGALDVAGRG